MGSSCIHVVMEKLYSMILASQMKVSCS
jgi:hypothetical protein